MQLGMIGLGRMGGNMMVRLTKAGHHCVVYGRNQEAVDAMVAKGATGTTSLPDFVKQLDKPRLVWLMVPAAAVDAVLATVVPLLDAGDTIIDGGNSYYHDDIRRAGALESQKLHYVDVGVSGGVWGLERGYCLMIGGEPDVVKRLDPIFQSIAPGISAAPRTAGATGAPEAAERGYLHCGPNGAGHFVKMVHNGIEYADMQLIAEAYDLLKNGVGLTNDELHTVFTQWNAGDLDSFLIEITAQIFARKDDESNDFLVDRVLDKAAQKGTGKWTAQNALDLGVPLTAITEAVYARALSSLKDQRVAASKVLPGPKGGKVEGDKQAFIDAVRDALYTSKVVAYAQGFDQMLAAAKEFGWSLHPGEIATIWRGGCIIRARFLDRIKDAYDQQPGLANLLLAPYFTEAVKNGQDGWRRVVSEAARLGIPIPAFSSCLAYYDGYRRATLPANLIQAQRDLFGAHTYERTDKPGAFHSQWVDDKQEPKTQAQHGVETTN